jgi:glycosyltransferase involved in cell wall biosynthesis
VAEDKRGEIRVLHLLKTSVGATWALRQTRELVKLGAEVHVALPDGPLVPRYVEAGVNVHLLRADLPLRSPGRCLKIIREFRELVETVRPDLIHSHFVGTTLTMRLALGKRCRIPRVFQVPGPLHLEHALFRNAEIALAGACDYWIASCQWTYDCYKRRGISEDRLFLSYYGLDLEEFVCREPGKLRQELGVGPETRLVGMVSYMYAPKRFLGQTRGIKGHEDLIDAVSLCLSETPNLVVVFIGGAWNGATEYEQFIRAYAKRRCGDNAVFLGTRSDVSELYPDLDVVVHPSHSDNVGGAAESLLLAIPTIATNVGGFPDVVIPGKTGWLVPPRRPEKLAEAITEALRDPDAARRMALAGQELTRKLFDVREDARVVLEAYRAILS